MSIAPSGLIAGDLTGTSRGACTLGPGLRRVPGFRLDFL